MARLVAAFVGALLAWLGIATSTSAAAVPSPPTVSSHAYGTPSYHQPADYTATGRGQPTTYNEGAPLGAVDHGPRGSSARPRAARSAATHDSDDASWLDQGDSIMETAREPAEVVNGDFRVFQPAGVAAKTAPEIKAGSMGGSTAGKRFPQSVKDETLADNPGTCVYCRMETNRPQVDHSIPMSRGGNATLDNAQTTCWWCNASKGARDFPVNPPPGFRGFWPPGWW